MAAASARRSTGKAPPLEIVIPPPGRIVRLPAEELQERPDLAGQTAGEAAAEDDAESPERESEAPRQAFNLFSPGTWFD